MAHLNVSGAFDANPLGAVMALTLATLVVFSLAALAFRLPRPRVAFSAREGYMARWVAAVLSEDNFRQLWGFPDWVFVGIFALQVVPLQVAAVPVLKFVVSGSV